MLRSLVSSPSDKMKFSMWKRLVMVLMILGSLADGERYKIPCKEGQYLDGLLHICTDCAVACHVPASQDCQKLCPGWPIISVDSSPSTESPPAVRTNTLVSVVVVLSTLATVVILVTGVIWWVQRRRLTVTRGQENGEAGNLRDHEDGENVQAMEEQDDNLEPAQEVGV